MKYQKVIRICETGQVVAEVYGELGRVVGKEIWTPIFRSNRATEKACVKAHTWADERIRICMEQEEKRL